MATYTTNYHLEKPAQSDLYNIDVFNGNADTIDTTLVSKSNLSNLATVESTNKASKAYAVGEYLVYNGLLYKVTTAIASGGTITPGTNVSTTTVDDELDLLLSRSMFQRQTLANNTDLNDATKVGIYTLNGGDTHAHMPGTATYGILTVFRPAPGASFMLQLVSNTGARVWLRSTTNNGSTWTSWVAIVDQTIGGSDGISIRGTYSENVSRERGDISRCGSLVCVNLCITTSASFTSNSTLISLSNSYKPDGTRDLVGCSGATSYSVYVNSSGQIKNSGTWPAGTYVITGVYPVTKATS